MVAKTTQLISWCVLFGLGLLCLNACSHGGISPLPRSSSPEFVVNWVKPTYSENFTIHRKINRMTPIVTDKLVIEGNNLEDLVAYRKNSGLEVWRRKFKGGVEAGALLFKDRLYVTANDSTVSALDVHNGQTIWSFQTSSENISLPVLDDQTGLLYFQNAQNMVFCLDAQSGKQVWVYSKNDATLITIRGAATPTLGHGIVYVGFSDGTFSALKASSGALVWDQNLNRNKKFRDIDAQAVLYKDIVIVSGYDDHVYALDIAKGTTVWSYPVGSDVAVTLVGDELYVGSTSNSVVKLKAQTGEVIWAYNQVKGVPTQVVTDDQFVIFGESQGNLKILNAESGKLLSSFEPGRGVFSKPYLDEKKSNLYFISGEAYLYNLKLVKNPIQSFEFVR
jgi:outer membrane protein assembly factor BamB